jgi:hypothetical protein
MAHPNTMTPSRMHGGGGMDYRDCFPRFPLLPGQPDRLLAELHEVQTTLAIVEYYINCWNVSSPAESAPACRRHYYAAHETLREARDIVDDIVEELRVQVAEIVLDADEKKLGE